MKELPKLLDLLEQKKKCFQLFEQEANEMCCCPMEELEAIMKKRQKLLKQVEAIDKEIQALCRPAGPQVEAALNNTCGRGELPSELARIYDASMQVKAVVSRIVENEDMIRNRLETEKAILLDKLEKTQKGSLAAASRYSASIQTGVASSMFSRDLGKV